MAKTIASPQALEHLVQELADTPFFDNNGGTLTGFRLDLESFGERKASLDPWVELATSHLMRQIGLQEVARTVKDEALKAALERDSAKAISAFVNDDDDMLGRCGLGLLLAWRQRQEKYLRDLLHKYGIPVPPPHPEPDGYPIRLRRELAEHLAGFAATLAAGPMREKIQDIARQLLEKAAVQVERAAGK